MLVSDWVEIGPEAQGVSRRVKQYSVIIQFRSVYAHQREFLHSLAQLLVLAVLRHLVSWLY